MEGAYLQPYKRSLSLKLYATPPTRPLPSRLPHGEGPMCPQQMPIKGRARFCATKVKHWTSTSSESAVYCEVLF